MKITPLLHVIVAILGTTGLYAQSPGSTCGITVSLTFSYTYPGTVVKDPETRAVIKDEDFPKGYPAFSNEWYFEKLNGKGDVTSTEEGSEFLSTQRSFKYGNKEIIQDLVWMGYLPEIGKHPYVAGWSLTQLAFPTPEEGVLFVARHTDGTVIDITDMINLHNQIAEEDEGFIGSSTQETSVMVTKEVFNVNTGESKITETHTSSQKSKFETKFTWFSDDSPMTMKGVHQTGRKLTFVNFRGEGETIKLPVYVPIASKITGISGRTWLGVGWDDEDVFALIEGSISLTPGKVTSNLDALLP